ncbi:MAG: hypothetical protein ABJN36_11930 [Cyclobacteriaceae bacterium]
MSWQIAKEMARINKENLDKLSRTSLKTKLQDRRYKNTKSYKYKKGNPELLASIRNFHKAENRKSLIKRSLLFLIIFGGMGYGFWYYVMFG